MRFVHDVRGTASVEIVVMLPLFIVLLAGVYHLHAAGSAALSAHERARGCALQFAVRGCDDVNESELCQGVLAAKASDVDRESATRAQGDAAAAELARARSILEQVEQIPLLGQLVTTLFGEGALARGERASPRFMEPGTRTHERTYYVVCNTVAKGWGDLLNDQVCALAKGQLGLSGAVLGCK